MAYLLTIYVDPTCDNGAILEEVYYSHEYALNRMLSWLDDNGANHVDKKEITEEEAIKKEDFLRKKMAIIKAYWSVVYEAEKLRDEALHELNNA